MPGKSTKAGNGPVLDPYRGNPRVLVKELVQQGHLIVEDLVEITEEFQAARKQTETSVARVLEGAEEKQLSPEETEELLSTVKARFEANMHRHEDMKWVKVQARLEASPEKLWSLNEMERTGGQPDVVGYDEKTGEYIFYDCSKESPEGRRSICYDREGQNDTERGGWGPKGNAVDMAAAMGIEMLTPEQYREFQELENFDSKSWSWLKTPTHKRITGFALSGGWRIIGVGVFEDSPSVYIDNRAFRGSLRV